MYIVGQLCTQQLCCQTFHFQIFVYHKAIQLDNGKDKKLTPYIHYSSPLPSSFSPYLTSSPHPPSLLPFLLLLHLFILSPYHLLVVGGDGGVLREVAKHKTVEEIHSCEINEVSVCSMYRHLHTNICKLLYLLLLLSIPHSNQFHSSPPLPFSPSQCITLSFTFLM